MTPTSHSRGSLAVAIVLPLGFIAVVGGVSSPWAVVGGVAILATCVSGARWIQDFWRSLLAGMGGGALAGLLILGPALRLAMRLVAVLDEALVPEFSVEGTLLVLSVGGILGSILGVVVTLLSRLFPHGIELAVAVLGVLVLSASGDLRQEMADLGVGLWVNLPLFGSVFYLYAMGAVRFTRRLGRVGRKGDRVEVAAVV